MQNRVSRYYKFAELNIHILSPEYEESEKIAKFRTTECDAEVEYDIEFTDSITFENGELIHSERGIYNYLQDEYKIRIMRHEKTNEIVMLDIEENIQKHKVFFLNKYPKAWGETMVMKILNLPRQIISFEGIFLHTSFIVWNEKAILFSGNKQIGKSTQAKLWKDYKNAFIANGDRAILKKINGEWYACGTPYCGTSQIFENVNIPLRCIVILEQGPENTVGIASMKEAFRSLMKNCSYDTWNKKQVEDALSLMEKISVEVQFIKLSCLPNQSSADALEEFLCQNQM